MDRILKLVYDNWTEGGFPLPNGRLPVVNELLRKDIKENNRESWSHAQHHLSNTIEGNAFIFDHSNFWSYYKRFNSMSAFVSPNQVVDDGAVYMWPIEIRTGLDDTPKNHTLVINQVTYQYSIKDTISPELFKLMQEGRVKIVINFAHDPINNMNHIKDIEQYFTSLGIAGSNIYIIPGNDCSGEYNRFFPEGKTHITPTKLLMCQQLASDILSFPRMTTLGYESDIVRESDLDKTVLRPKKFLCFNRTLRAHRYALAYMAVKMNLLENSIFSFLNMYDNTEVDSVLYDLESFEFEDANDFAKTVFDLVPYELDTQHLSADERRGFNSANNKQSWFTDTYIHITSETRFIEGETPFVSEKTWKPISNLQPFIMVGNPGTLKYIKELGFKTFSPFIDESYDEMADYKVRMRHIYSEIERLNNMSIKEIHDWYYSIKDVLLHNQQLLISMSSMNPYEETFTYLKGN